MKEKMKKSLLSLALVVCMVCLSCVTVFAAKDKVLTEDQVASYKSGAVKVIEQIAGLSDEEIQNYLDQDDDFVTAALTSWNNAKDELGAYVEVGDQTVTTDGNNVIINSDVTYENKTADVELIINSKTNTSESMAFNINYTMAEKMEQAGLNTLMGLGIVFLMLIFLSFLISQFKHISKLTEKNKPAAPAAQLPLLHPQLSRRSRKKSLPMTENWLQLSRQPSPHTREAPAPTVLLSARSRDQKPISGKEHKQ